MCEIKVMLRLDHIAGRIVAFGVRHTRGVQDPRKAVERAVWGMLPKNKLSRQLLGKLKVYSGPEHPHAAQQPKPYTITQIAQ